MNANGKSRPLPPTYRIERARIDEHDAFMNAARLHWPNQPICPDCYKPPHLCAHMNLRRKP